MDWLNYHHLLYFWTVAREGGLDRACRALRLAKPTVSGQIRQLEAALGEKLFNRRGRALVPTEFGRVVLRFADEIFSVGRELMDTVRGRPTGRSMRLLVGVADVLPKPIVRRLLQPALRLDTPVRVICREDQPVEEFVAQLGLYNLDVVLSDAPVGPGIHVRAFSHLLGECGTSFFAARRLAGCRRGFPRTLERVPILLPGAGSTLRRGLDQWLHALDLRPVVAGEFDDSALMNVFGQDGVGVFAGPSVIETDIRRRYQVTVVGRVEAVRQRFYAISVERRLTHPAVVAICETARRDLFG